MWAHGHPPPPGFCNVGCTPGTPRLDESVTSPDEIMLSSRPHAFVCIPEQFTRSDEIGYRLRRWLLWSPE